MKSIRRTNSFNYRQMRRARSRAQFIKGKTHKKIPASTRAESVIAAFTIIGCALSIATLLSIQKQIDFAKTSAAESSRQTQDALNISQSVADSTKTQAEASLRQALAGEQIAASGKRQADNAANGVELTRKSLYNQLSSNVAINLKIDQLIEPGKKISGHLSINNTGNASISDMEMGVASWFTERDDSLGKTARNFTYTRAQKPTLASGEAYRFPFTVEGVTDELLGYVKADRMRIYVILTFRYRDANGDHEKHLCASSYGRNYNSFNYCDARRDF